MIHRHRQHSHKNPRERFVFATNPGRFQSMPPLLLWDKLHQSWTDDTGCKISGVIYFLTTAVNFSQRIKAVIKEKKAHSGSPCNVCVLRVKKTAEVGRQWQRGAQGQPVDYVAFFLLVRVTWFGSLLATGANLCGQRAGIDKTWSPLGSLSVAPLATRRYKLLNTFPSCTVPRVRQEICTGDLASNGAVPQRFWTHARLRYG